MDIDELHAKECNGVSHRKLTELAFRALIGSLEGYGNEPSDAQKAALYEIVGTYTFMAQGVLAGRWAFPLATGLGKSQSIVAWLGALNYLGHDHISVAVCASKVESLCDLKRDLIETYEVPEAKIGLYHSYPYDKAKVGEPGYASLPCTEDHNSKQIILVTHNRVRGKCGPDRYNLFQGKPRDLMIWDESLLVSDTRAIRHRDVKAGLAWLQAMLEGTKDNRREACDYLQLCSDTLQAELERLKDGGPPATVKLPVARIQDFKSSLGKNPVVTPLKELLDMSQMDLRMAVTDQGGGLITYDIAVPRELENIVILDASHTIRDLVKLDPSIKRTGRFSENILSYRNVTIHQLKHFSGRSTMTEAFRPSKRESRKVSLEIAEVVNQIPLDEGIIIFTFKPHEVNFEKILKRDFKAGGIDIEATLQIDGQERPRFVWLHWGQETSLSKHSYCSNVLFAGVLHRDHIEIASAIAGQKDDLLTPISSELVREVVRSEIGHCLYQAMSRGSCRIVKGRETRKMNVWLLHRDASIRELLNKVMPGVTWKDWPSKFITKDGGKIDKLALLISDYLDKQEGKNKVSSKSIKAGLDLKGIPPATFTCAIETLCRQNTGWNLEGRSMARVFQG